MTYYCVRSLLYKKLPNSFQHKLPSTLEFEIVKFRTLSTMEKESIIRLHGTSMSQTDIAAIFSVNQGTISRIINQITPLVTKKQSGRLQKTSARLDNIIHWEVKKNPSVTSAALQHAIPGLKEVSTRTIHHHLCKDLKLPARKPQKKPLLTLKM